MFAPPLQIHALRHLPNELRGTLAMGLAERLDLPHTDQEPAAEPMPWPGVLHEVFTAAGEEAQRFSSHHPFPAGILIGWARRQLGQGKGRMTVWIGRRVWPYPLVLDRAGLLGGSFFVDAKDNNQRLWAAELALQCSAVATVIADGSDFAMPATRRLQLISRQSETLMLLARPSRDERQLSAAGARWRISADCMCGEPGWSQWKVELLRCKGVRPSSIGCHGQAHPAWMLRWDAELASTRFIDTEVEHEGEETGFSPAAAVPGGLSANLGDRPDHAPPASPRRAG